MRTKVLTTNQWTERVGFEPTEPCGSPDFKSGAFDHSATSPGVSIYHIRSGGVLTSGLVRSRNICSDATVKVLSSQTKDAWVTMPPCR